MCVVVILAAVSVSAHAQSSASGPRIWVGYYGELATHPGIAVGAQFRLVDAGWYELTAGPVLGFYFHPRNNVSLFLDADLENRFVLPSGLYFTVGANAGYLHSWLAGDGVYSRGDDGSVDEVRDWGRPYAKTGGSLGLGWDLSRTGAAPLSIFARLDVFAQYPFNDSILPHAAVLAGAAYQTGGAE
jgi:hypothetical protein